MRRLTAADFAAAQPPQALGNNEIHLWFFPIWEGSTSALADSAGIRALLAGYLGCAPGQVTIERDEHGKPRLLNSGLQFNLSHSGGAVLVGVSLAQALGVDLEISRRSRKVLELARRYFHADEAAALAALPESRRQAAFLRLWSCKEALLKAQGRGIAFGLHRVVVGMDADGEVIGLQAIDDKPAASWHIWCICPPWHGVAALAWQGPELSVRAFKAGPPGA